MFINPRKLLKTIIKRITPDKVSINEKERDSEVSVLLTSIYQYFAGFTCT